MIKHELILADLAASLVQLGRESHSLHEAPLKSARHRALVDRHFSTENVRRHKPLCFDDRFGVNTGSVHWLEGGSKCNVYPSTAQVYLPVQLQR